MRHVAIVTVIGLGLGLNSNARADIAPPLPPAKNAVAVKIEVDENATGWKLVVPNGVFTPPRVRPIPKGDPKSELPEGQPHNQLLIVGVALTLAFAFSGLWLLRRHGRGSVTGLTLLVAAGAALMVGAVTWANAPPVNKLPPKPVHFPVASEGKAEVTFTYGQEPVRLILDKASYEKLKKGELTAPPK